MRNIPHLKQAIQPVNGGGRPRQIQSALEQVNLGHRALLSGTNVRDLANKRQLQDRWPDERLMDSVTDPSEGLYTVHKTDPFERMDEQRLIDCIGLPSFSSGNSGVTLTTPRRELSPEELKEQQATRQIINNKLINLALVVWLSVPLLLLLTIVRVMTETQTSSSIPAQELLVAMVLLLVPVA